MKLGANLKYIRTKDLWTQEQIANELGIKRSTYKEYENQNSIIPIVHLNQFCNFFNISIDYVFELTNESQYDVINYHIDKNLSGKRLKELRKSKKLTQKELANILNTTQSVIADYERGRYYISTSFLYKLVKLYNISIDYLLGRTNYPNYLNIKKETD